MPRGRSLRANFFSSVGLRVVFSFVAVAALFFVASRGLASPPTSSPSAFASGAPSASASAATSASSAAPTGSGSLDSVKAALDAAKPPASQAKVYIGYHVYSIRSVDLRGQTFYADFYLWLRFSNVDDDTAKSIKSNLEFMNGRPDSQTVSDEKMIGDKTYYICWRVQGTFNFIATLKKYPFDTQDLEIEIENSDLESKDMIFVNDYDTYERSGQAKNMWAIRSDVQVPDFDLRKVNLRVEDELYKTDFGDLTPGEKGDFSKYSRSTIQMHFKRDFMPYVYKILIPLFVIVAMAYLVFFLPAKEVSTATGITITALLSCIAFNVAVAQNMPDVGYLVISDWFFIFSYVIVFFTLVENIATYVLDEAGKGALADKIELFARIAVPILYFAAFGYLLMNANVDTN